ncbi:ATP-dependent nuclease [Thalassospira tepidiphila]|uniref:ATP-dependent nuclease n=1 Tax=Thalassospira tepidiphila TaxID=393657 RepID=UPI00291F52A7|nr:hypothetical protein MACH01_11550 [Thalassospira tepidiphila]
MLKGIHFKFGRSVGHSDQYLDVKPLTVFVGPNNSGKSLILREINQYLQGGNVNPNAKVLKKIELEGFSTDEAMIEIARLKQEPSKGDVIPAGNIVIGNAGNRAVVPLADLRSVLIATPPNSHQFCQWFLRFKTLFLDGPSRIGLVGQQGAGDMQTHPTGTLQVLIRDDHKREKIREILFDSFGEYFVIDPTSLGQLRIRMSPEKPVGPEVERSFTKEAIDFQSRATPIEEKSDGVKAFTGIIQNIMAGDPSVLLIDEPEAFLHPSLSFKLGKHVSIETRGTNKKVFASTHSASFVRGCIQSGAPVNIVRLTYRAGVPTVRILEHQDLENLMKDPLLRSTKAIEGLFSEFVVVCEADSDRAFYEEINERLAAARDDRAIPNCLFINAQNKQTIPSIVRPLREMGIPAVGIVDLDVLKDGGQEWTKQLKSVFVPEPQHGSLAQDRKTVLALLDQANADWKRSGGISVLNGEGREACENLLQTLSSYGLFVVPTGELESWLAELGVQANKSAWLVKMFEALGANPSDSSYKQPQDGDVWDFVAKIREWMVNPHKKGVPF